jgi:hypothetical protein
MPVSSRSASIWQGVPSESTLAPKMIIQSYFPSMLSTVCFWYFEKTTEQLATATAQIHMHKIKAMNLKNFFIILFTFTRKMRKTQMPSPYKQESRSEKSLNIPLRL